MCVNSCRGQQLASSRDLGTAWTALVQQPPLCAPWLHPGTHLYMRSCPQSRSQSGARPPPHQRPPRRRRLWPEAMQHLPQRRRRLCRWTLRPSQPPRWWRRWAEDQAGGWWTSQPRRNMCRSRTCSQLCLGAMGVSVVVSCPHKAPWRCNPECSPAGGGGDQGD